jgi:hypothetical protein
MPHKKSFLDHYRATQVNIARGMFRNPLADYPQPGAIDREANFKWRLIKYDELLKNYSARELTYSNDALAAFQGIIKVLETSWFTGRSIDDAYTSSAEGSFWGLPASALPLSLLFTHEGAHERRSDFPSWSWVGWKGKLDKAFRGRESGAELHHVQPAFRAWKWEDERLQPIFERRFPFQETDEDAFKVSRLDNWTSDMLFVEGYVWNLKFNFVNEPEPPQPTTVYEDATELRSYEYPFVLRANIRGFPSQSSCKIMCYNQITRDFIQNKGQVTGLLCFNAIDHSGDQMYDFVLLDWFDIDKKPRGCHVFKPYEGGMAQRIGSIRLIVNRSNLFWQGDGEFKPHWSYMPMVIV